MAWFALHKLILVILILQIISIYVLTSPNFAKFSSVGQKFSDGEIDSILPILDKVKVKKELGLLHTIKAYTKWSVEEEKLINFFCHRLARLVIDRQVIKRFTDSRASSQKLSKLIGILRKSSIDYKLLFYLKELNLSLNKSSRDEWVGSEDLQMSLIGILNLQVTYLIPANSLSNGQNFDSNFGGNLSDLDCVILGLYSLTTNRFATAALWLQSGKIQKQKHFTSDLLNTIYFVGLQTHNLKFLTALPTTKELQNEVVEDLYPSPIINEILPSNLTSNKMLHFQKYRGNDSEFRFKKLCNGHSLQSLNLQAKLRCYLENKKNPYLYINPIKVEQLSNNPSILQFYEIMSNSSIDTIERPLGSHATITHMWIDNDNVAHPLFRSAPVTATTSARMTITNFGKYFKNTHFLISVLTGLLVPKDPNNNMYNEHVYGRHFRLHTDGIYTESSTGIPADDDMIASMVLYLKMPVIGGCTAFVNVGVCSRPVKGSAIFWYNMFRNGTYTKQLVHGGCPVYHGYKMSISFFFKYNSNWNKRICLRNKLE